MRVSVDFQDESVDLDLPEGRLVTAWRGPAGVAASEVPGLVLHALENPVGYPPLRQAVVPGDRVVIALGADVPEAPSVLAAVCRVLESAGIDRDSITVLTDPDAPADFARSMPPGVNTVRHDPDDRPQLAYLASTAEDRRVYLNRLLTDADFVLPVGGLGYDPVLGYRGPWGAIFPDLSDTETQRSYRAGASDATPDRLHPRPLLKESAEVSWLLGSQFQLAMVAGVSGVVAAVAGLGATVLEHGAGVVDDAWGVRAESRAELVVAGVGRPGEPTSIDDVARGWRRPPGWCSGAARSSSFRGRGEFGPALRRLVAADDPPRRPGRAPRATRRTTTTPRPAGRAGPGLGRCLPAQRARPGRGRGPRDGPPRSPRGGATTGRPERIVPGREPRRRGPTDRRRRDRGIDPHPRRVPPRPPDPEWDARLRYWSRKLGRLRLGVEPIDEQVARYRRATMMLSAIAAVIALDVPRAVHGLPSARRRPHPRGGPLRAGRRPRPGSITPILRLRASGYLRDLRDHEARLSATKTPGGA